jgi:uncharacterized protein
MHKAFVAQFEIAATDPDALRRFYALLFGWRFSPGGADARQLSVMSPDSNGIRGVITGPDDHNSARVKLLVEVDDVFENLCYAEELGGRIIDPPHEVVSSGRRETVASFADPEGNRVGLSNGSDKLDSAHELPG